MLDRTAAATRSNFGGWLDRVATFLTAIGVTVACGVSFTAILGGEDWMGIGTIDRDSAGKGRLNAGGGVGIDRKGLAIGFGSGVALIAVRAFWGDTDGAGGRIFGGARDENGVSLTGVFEGNLTGAEVVLIAGCRLDFTDEILILSGGSGLGLGVTAGDGLITGRSADSTSVMSIGSSGFTCGCHQ